MASELECTIVFQKNWEAIHALNPDGTRKYRYILNEGSSRSSKTTSLIDCIDLYARSEVNKRITVWRDTLTDCKKTVLDDTLKHLKRTGRYRNEQIFNVTKSIFTYLTQSTFEIHGTDNEETVHGLTQDVAWFNEPYNISLSTFNQIDQRTSDFIIIDYNPKRSDHWLDDIKKDERSIIIRSTFNDNPFCPAEQRNKILSYQSVTYSQVVIQGFLSANDARKYDMHTNKLLFTEKQLKELARCRINEDKNSANDFNWCVYGLGIKAERPNRIYKWTKISKQFWDDLDVPIYYGIDWGTEHPWGIVAYKYYDGGIYVHELNYLSENKLRAKLTPSQLSQIEDGEDGLMSWYFEKFEIQKPGIIICDNNRKNKILKLRKMGYNAMPAYKEAGSVVDGIDEVNTLKVFYTNTSTNIEYEQENYVRKVDRYGIVLEEPVDADNHCFIGSTLIYTDKGQKEISCIEAGDNVLTSKGFREVLHKWDNGIKKVCSYSMQFDTFVLKITCTPNHKIKTDKGWIEIQNVNATHKIYLHNILTENNTDFTLVKDIFQGVEKGCTQKYGKIKMAKYRKDIMCITLMKTLKIMNCQISNLKTAFCTYLNMVKRDIEKMLNGQKNFMQKALRRLKNGTPVQMVTNGIKMHGKTHWEFYLKIGNTTVTIANQNTYQELPIHPAQDFAQTNVSQHIEESQELMTSLENAHTVLLNLKSIDIVEKEHVHQNVQKVYDLLVDDTHEYFANGILVHNCMDPIRYVTTWLIRRGIIKKL